MGSFTSLFMQALFNTSVSIKNIVVKYRAPQTLSTLTCGALDVYTAAGAWRLALKVSRCCLVCLLPAINVAAVAERK